MPSDLRLFTGNGRWWGENLARTIRVIAKLLLDWSTAQKLRASAGKEEGLDGNATALPGPLPALRSIFFDKLVMLYGNVWDELKRQNPKKIRSHASCIVLPGIHGHGRALAINRPDVKDLEEGYNEARCKGYAFITEVVDTLKPGMSNDRTLFSLDKPASDPRCKVRPQLVDSLWQSWQPVSTSGASASDSPTSEVVESEPKLSMKREEYVSDFLTFDELQYVQAISSMISSLVKEEIRALGTHVSLARTREAIEFNLSIWERNFARAINFLRGLSTDDKVGEWASRLVSTSREVLRKSDTNRKAYEDGRKKALERLTTWPDVRQAFEDAQRPAAEIWEDRVISAYRTVSQTFLDFSLYCRRVLVEVTGKSRLSRRDMSESDEAFGRLSSFFLPKAGFPFPSFQDFRSLDHGQIADILLKMKREVFQILPVSQDRKDLGVP